jgi:hypothetical protein
MLRLSLAPPFPPTTPQRSLLQIQTKPQVLHALLCGRDPHLRRNRLFQYQLQRKSTLVRNITLQRGVELFAIVGKYLRVVGPARDGDIGDAVVEQVLCAELGT